jgi:UDP-glucose 4-epimerase
MYAIFGANGFVGRHVVARLVAEGLPVRAVSRRFDPEFEAAFSGRAELVVADLRDPFGCLAALEGVQSVLQLVSTSSPGLKNDYLERDITDNVLPQLRLAQDCLTAGVRRHVFISSGGTVYGRPLRLPIDEAHPQDPLSSHGMTKLAVEKYLGLLGHTRGLDSVILRVSNLFGPGQIFRKGQGLIPAILEHHRRGQPVQIFGDGSARRDFVYIDDAVDAILAAFRIPAARGGIFNIGSGEARSVNEILDAIEARVGAAVLREHLPARASDVELNLLDIRRATAVLGWTPATGFAVAMDRTVAAALRGPGPTVGPAAGAAAAGQRAAPAGTPKAHARGTA